MKQSSVYGPNVVLMTEETKSLVLTVASMASNCTDQPCNPAVDDTPPTGEFVLKIDRIGTARKVGGEFYSQAVVGNRITFQFGTLLVGVPLGRYAAQLTQNNVALATFEIQIASPELGIIHSKTTV